jgi:polysaccharide deacetylase family protein (PEP-CTERM system associated)
MKNAFSIDLEDWFCVRNLASIFPFSEWKGLPLRVEQNVTRLLEILDKHGVKSTFFVLGWVAERVPGLVRAIAQAGHEIATHGYGHLQATAVTPAEFEQDIAKSLEVLRQIVPAKVLGFRAPSFSITRKTLWAFDILTKYGIKYDSSIFPIGFHPDYGVKNTQLSIYSIHDSLQEFPLSCFRFLGTTVPCCGGGYFRLFPYAMTRYGLKQCNRENRPAVFYIHPWEIDAGQPRVKNLPLFKRFRHYVNLEKTEERLHRLLSDFEFTTIASVLKLS